MPLPLTSVPRRGGHIHKLFPRRVFPLSESSQRSSQVWPVESRRLRRSVPSLGANRGCRLVRSRNRSESSSSASASAAPRRGTIATFSNMTLCCNLSIKVRNISGTHHPGLLTASVFEVYEYSLIPLSLLTDITFESSPSRIPRYRRRSGALTSIENISKYFHNHNSCCHASWNNITI